MDRRGFFAGSASAGLVAAGWLRAADAQQPNRPMIGLLDGVWGHVKGEVGRGLRENGIGRFKFEFSRWPPGSGYQVDYIARYAALLVEQQVGVILACSNKPALAAKSVTDTIPIVFLADDPVANGLVDRLDRPGGNLTGAAIVVSGLTAKRIELIRQLVPTTELVVLVTDPTNAPTHDVEVREAQAAVTALGLELSTIAWTGEHLIEPELAALPRDRKAVLVFGAGLPFIVNHALSAYLATRYGFPAIHGVREAVESGGLISFGTRFADGGYQMGVCAARILKGDKPADLPVRQITGTELVINPRAAKSLGIRIPAALLGSADEVID
jgi:putative tryptophan/tyrosine transport system substrate-binding protein